jgi:thiosulfate dehydrogenase [quinone] large subunit
MKKSSTTTAITDAPFITALFSSPKWAWLWLIVRVYVGYEWLEAGWHKVTSADWMQTGAALKGFWTYAVMVPDAPAKPAINYEWYRSFIQFLLDHGSYVWFAKLVAVGELLVGIGLILGIFVGLAAFFGGLMNFSYLLAGTISSNPVLLVLSILLMIAWKIAGRWGGNYFLFKYVGTPWNKGKWFMPKEAAKSI